MSDFLSVLDLVNFIRSNDSKNFKLNLTLLPNDVTTFTDLLNENEKEIAADWCRKSGIYLLHNLFRKITTIDSIKFIKDNLDFYKTHHLLDDEERTWLHISVLNNRSKEILKYLIENLKIEVEKCDTNKMTALHFACQKTDYNEGELTILMKESHQLITRSLDDITPLELACTDKRKLKEIKSNKNINLIELLVQIDKISSGLLVTEDFIFNLNLPPEKIWLSLLQKNNKYRLIDYIKKDKNFSKKYYLSNNEINYIIAHCHENGLGVFTFIKNKYIKSNSKMNPAKLFTELTGLKIREISEKESTENQQDQEFYQSSLFISLITGRFELVSVLLTCSQFHPISYGLLVCLICRNLSLVKYFPNEVIESILKLKIYCEKYAIAVMSRTVFRDFTVDNSIVSGFLNKPNILGGQRILDIAYLGKCSKFLSLPSCQGALTTLWYKRNRKCPVMKFYVHASIHCIFLAFFSYILVHNFYSKISIIEIFCYIYGLGYFLEESRQIYIYRQKDFIKSYLKDATNYIDIGSLGFMLIGFVLRLSLRASKYSNQSDEGLFMESKDINLFVVRLILCISLILFFMRIIYYGSIFEQLGPKLKMISVMIVRNLLPLIFIFIVFITSFGIAFQALLFPNNFYGLNNTENFERRPISIIFFDLFRRTTYTIFHTHYALEEMEHRETPYFVHNEGNIAVYFLLVIYMIVVNIMLINLLIALFSYTVTAITQTSSESWKLNRYKDLKEYYDRSMLPPPINIFEIIVELIWTHSKKPKVLKISEEEEEVNLIKNNVNEVKYSSSISFKIIQAFALRLRRHKLVLKTEDEEYESKTEIKAMKKAIEQIEKIMKEKCQKNDGTHCK